MTPVPYYRMRSQISSLVITAFLALVGNIAPSFGDIQVTGASDSPISQDLNSTQRNTACDKLGAQESHQIGRAAAPAWPWQIYKSVAANPPEMEITTNGRPLAPGFLFLTPSDASPVAILKESGPLIMTDSGQLVWNGPNVRANDLRVASFEGKDVLTYWTGVSTSGVNLGHGYGNVTFLDSSYEEILVVCPHFGLVTPDDTVYQCEGDFHESFVTSRNTILMTAYNITQADLTAVGGPEDGWVYDSLFFELDPRTGETLFSWSALEHVSIADTKLPTLGAGYNQSFAFDWFHINSVVNVDDKYLINSRHVWSTYLLSSSGDIIWTLQGETGGDFGSLPPEGQFAWQHFAQLHNVTKDSMSISLFNDFNSGLGNATHPSTLLELRLPLVPNKSIPPIAVQHQSDASDPLYSVSQGSLMFLFNGNLFGGYGQIPVMREFGPNDPSGGDLRWSARFGPDNVVQSYRAFKQVWHGYPTTVPSLVVDFDGDGCGTAYVSWNGATDVSTWAVFEGPDKDHLSSTGQVGHLGFETKFAVSGPCVQVAATVKGKVTRSDTVCRGV